MAFVLLYITTLQKMNARITNDVHILIWIKFLFCAMRYKRNNLTVSSHTNYDSR